jgi:hypothetical protein
MNPETKKKSLVELAESLGFKSIPDDDPIYRDGWIISTTVPKELECLNIPKRAKKRSGKENK